MELAACVVSMAWRFRFETMPVRDWFPDGVECGASGPGSQVLLGLGAITDCVCVSQYPLFVLSCPIKNVWNLTSTDCS